MGAGDVKLGCVFDAERQGKLPDFGFSTRNPSVTLMAVALQDPIVSKYEDESNWDADMASCRLLLKYITKVKLKL
jgi:hypothetical protein